MPPRSSTRETPTDGDGPTVSLSATCLDATPTASPSPSWQMLRSSRLIAALVGRQDCDVRCGFHDDDDTKRE